MKIKTLALSLAAAATFVAPVGFSAAAADGGLVRMGAALEDGSEVGGSTVLLAVLGAAAAIAAIVAITDDSDDPISA